MRRHYAVLSADIDAGTAVVSGSGFPAGVRAATAKLAGPRGPTGTAFGTPLLNRPQAEFEEAISLLQQATSELEQIGVDMSTVVVYRDTADLLQQKAKMGDMF